MDPGAGRGRGDLLDRRSGPDADALRESGLLDLTSGMFNVGMLLVGAMILVQGLRERSRGVEVGFAVGVAAIAINGFARGISVAERSHLIEYTVLALNRARSPAGPSASLRWVRRWMGGFGASR